MKFEILTANKNYLAAIEKIKSESWRYYHSFENHIMPMIDNIEKDDNIVRPIKDIYIAAAIYHDVVYDPKSNTNEIDSIQYFRSHFPTENKFTKNVIKLIESTIEHKSNDEFVRTFLKFDLAIFEGDFSNLIKNKTLLRKEFKFHELNIWKEGSTKILKKIITSDLLTEKAKENIKNEIEFIKFFTPKTAIYAGSFNPFHLGHLDILKKAEKVFDEVIVIYAKNYQKEECEINIPDCLKYHQVYYYDGAITELIKSYNYPVSLIRGLRNYSDFQSEINYCQFINELSGDSVSIVPIFADSKFQHISSSSIREIQKIYGKESVEAKKYLPK